MTIIVVYMCSDSCSKLYVEMCTTIQAALLKLWDVVLCRGNSFVDNYKDYDFRSTPMYEKHLIGRVFLSIVMAALIGDCYNNTHRDNLLSLSLPSLPLGEWVCSYQDPW